MAASVYLAGVWYEGPWGFPAVLGFSALMIVAATALLLGINEPSPEPAVSKAQFEV